MRLFVLDIAVTADSEKFPHVILPVGEGVAYVFIKKTPAGLRYVVGQEDVIEATEADGIQDYWQELLDAGLAKTMPFLSKAKVEKIWHGLDAGNKTLRLEEVQPGLIAANCGSAIRSCAFIGQNVAERLLAG
jgi:hypothetical protein